MVLDKPPAREIAAWVEAGQQPGGNQPVEIAGTEIGGLHRLALEQGLPRPRDAGEIGVVAWRTEQVRYGERSTAERVNGGLKDNHGGRTVRVRGPDKVMCHLRFGVLSFTVLQLGRLLT